MTFDILLTLGGIFEWEPCHLKLLANSLVASSVVVCVGDKAASMSSAGYMMILRQQQWEWKAVANAGTVNELK